MERATYDALALRFIAANRHPDHDTLATFRRRFTKEFAVTFVQVLQVGQHRTYVIPTTDSRTPDCAPPPWRRRAPGRRAQTVPG